MSSVNKVILVGRVGKQPEIRHTDNGKTVANFSLATSEVFKDKQGNKKEVTEWHNLVVWDKPAEIVEKYVNKGELLYLEGQLKTRSWEKDGVTRYVTEVYVNDLRMLGSKKQSELGDSEAVSNNSNEDTDSLPF